MSSLPPLTVAVPLAAGAAVLALAFFAGRRAVDTFAIASGVLTLGLCGVLLDASLSGPAIHWMGGWTPRRGLVLGIDLYADPVAAGLAVLVAVLALCALVFCWRFFDHAGGLFHSLTLVFEAAMIGFALSGDVFNMFVFFELMTVAALALTGYKTAESQPLQGALNFGVVNAVGGFCFLLAVALLYGRTGQLNLAALGRALESRPPDALVTAAVALATVAMLTKAAAVPVHFWLADAHAVAPSPVCALFSGVMVTLGLYGFARLHYAVFEGALSPDTASLRVLVVGAGVLTAVVGALMCFAQEHLKRLLAFSTVSHAGLMLVGVGTFGSLGLAGAGLWALSDGLVKGALFLAVGVLLHRTGTVEEVALHGRGRGMGLLAVLWFLGGAALAGVPPFGSATGKHMVDEAAALAGMAWVPWVATGCSAVIGGAVLRAGVRVFLGAGRRAERDVFEQTVAGEEEQPETLGGRDRTPPFMVIPAALLVLAALATGVAPGVARAADSAAATFVDRAAYAAFALEGEAPVHHPPSRHAGLTPAGALYGLAGLAGAAALAAVALFVRPPVERGGLAALHRAADRVRALHSGHVGDYVAWQTFALALLGGLLWGIAAR